METFWGPYFWFWGTLFCFFIQNLVTYYYFNQKPGRAPLISFDGLFKKTFQVAIGHQLSTGARSRHIYSALLSTFYLLLLFFGLTAGWLQNSASIPCKYYIGKISNFCSFKGNASKFKGKYCIHT